MAAALLRFIDGHPRRKELQLKLYRRRREFFVPVFKGRRMPDYSKLVEPAPGSASRAQITLLHEDRDYYGSRALVMFRPFRSLSDLKDTKDIDWWTAFERQRHMLPDDGHAVLHRMQEYYTAFVKTADAALPMHTQLQVPEALQGRQSSLVPRSGV